MLFHLDWIDQVEKVTSGQTAHEQEHTLHQDMDLGIPSWPSFMQGETPLVTCVHI